MLLDWLTASECWFLVICHFVSDVKVSAKLGDWTVVGMTDCHCWFLVICHFVSDVKVGAKLGEWPVVGLTDCHCWFLVICHFVSDAKVGAKLGEWPVVGLTDCQWVLVSCYMSFRVWCKDELPVVGFFRYTYIYIYIYICVCVCVCVCVSTCVYYSCYLLYSWTKCIQYQWLGIYIKVKIV